MSGITTELAALADVRLDYELIRDCIAGERAIKKKRERYLPVPDPDEPDKDVLKNRYDTYLFRAVFLGVTGRTLRGLVGLVYDKDPVVQVPGILKPVVVDASGSGTSLDQQSQRTLGDVIAMGRCGLLADYPRTTGPTTRADQLSGNIRPTITRYMPEQIINWRTRTVGSKIMLSLVVVMERFVVDDDGFAETPGTQYRAMRLDEAGVYQVEIYRDVESKGYEVHEKYTPTDGKGQPLREIPFVFVGAEDNDVDIDRPPLLDIAELNVAHYRNSADYEESVFMVGQATPVLSGLTKQWVTDVLKGVVRLGSRGAIPLPEGGKAELLQAEPNSLAFEAMTHKEQQMISLGAKLIENSGTMQTATEATIDAVLDNSVLATAARNVSKAYRQCLTWCNLFATGVMVDDPEVIDYELQVDFASKMLNSTERAEIVAEWVKGAITWEEMRWNLKRSGVAYEDDELAKEVIAQAREDTMAEQVEQSAALVDATGAAAPAPSQGS